MKEPYPRHSTTISLKYMTPILTASQMRQADHHAIHETGIPGLVLMENAARGCFEVIYEFFEQDVANRTMLVLCGGGNNGGDGLAIARHAALHEMYSVCVLLVPREKLGDDAAAQLAMLTEFPEVEIVEGAEALHSISEYEFDLILDAMLGTGAHGAPRSPFAEAIELANGTYCPKIAVDIPTGVNSDTGEVAGTAFEADATITMGALKPGLLLGEGPDYAGETFVAHIGAPPSLYDNAQCFLLDQETALPGVPEVLRNRHKYDRGKALVLAGSDGMTGAGLLASSAAIKSGAGLVVLGTPESAAGHAVSRLPAEIMSLTLPSSDGAFGPGAFAALADVRDQYDVIALGPGITQAEHAASLAKEIVRNAEQTLVLDADGLNAFSGQGDELAEREAPLIITPHEGELKRLLGISTNDPHSAYDPLAVARTAAVRCDCIVVLKGAPTMIAIPDGTVWINSHGNPGMATAGAGDVLTGILAGLLAGCSQEDILAGVLTGVYLHSLAADLAAEELGVHSLTASDIIAFLPEAFAVLEGEWE